MAAKEIAYTPLNNSIQNPVAPTNIDKPSYEDQGVKYQGYSKTLLSGNNYRLNVQTPVHKILQYTALVGATRNDSFTLLPPQGKTFYLASMEVNTSVAAFDPNSIINLVSDDTQEIFYTIRPVRSETYTVIFPIPIKCFSDVRDSVSPRGFAVYSNPGGTTINNCTINFHGWIE